MSLITITNGIGCNGTEIAERVARRLDLAVYDNRRLQDEALKMEVTSQALGNLYDKAPGFLDRLLGDKPQIYLDLMESVIYHVARRDAGVILGHGSPWLLRDFGCALHVRVYASSGQRVRRIMEQRGISRESAEKMMNRSDKERRGFMQFWFKMDWNDLSLYDLVINGDKLSPDSGAGVIIEAANREEIKTCSLSSLKAMGRLSLAKRVEAVFLKNRIDFHELEIEVPEEGVVWIRGSRNPFDSEATLVEVVKQVPGVSEVRCEVKASPMPEI